MESFENSWRFFHVFWIKQVEKNMREIKKRRKKNKKKQQWNKKLFAHFEKWRTNIIL